MFINVKMPIVFDILTFFSMTNTTHSAILLTFIKLPFVIKIFVLSIFEWPFYTGFTIYPQKNYTENLRHQMTKRMIL